MIYIKNKLSLIAVIVTIFIGISFFACGSNFEENTEDICLKALHGIDLSEKKNITYSRYVDVRRFYMKAYETCEKYRDEILNNELDYTIEYVLRNPEREKIMVELKAKRWTKNDKAVERILSLLRTFADNPEIDYSYADLYGLYMYWGYHERACDYIEYKMAEEEAVTPEEEKKEDYYNARMARYCACGMMGKAEEEFRKLEKADPYVYNQSESVYGIHPVYIYRRLYMNYCACGMIDEGLEYIDGMREKLEKPDYFDFDPDVEKEEFVKEYNDTEIPGEPELIPYEYALEIKILEMKMEFLSCVEEYDELWRTWKDLWDYLNENYDKVYETYRRISWLDRGDVSTWPNVHTPVNLCEHFIDEGYCDEIPGCDELEMYKKARKTIPKELIRKGSCLESEYEDITEKIREIKEERKESKKRSGTTGDLNEWE